MVDAITYRTNDPSRWGAGKDANLTNEEIDINFWTLYIAMVELEMYPPQPVEIVEITVTAGNQMTILMSDGSTWGPFELPQAALAWTGDFQPNHDYALYDMLIANDKLYLVTEPHTSGPTFVMGPQYQYMYDLPRVFDAGFFVPQQPGFGIPDDEPMASYLCVRSWHLLEDAPGSLAKLRVDPAVDLVVDVALNGTLIGAITFAAGSVDGTMAIDATQFNAGDVLSLLRPTDIDTDAKDLSITFAGRLGTP